MASRLPGIADARTGQDGHVAMKITDAPDRQRFEARDDGKLMGIVTYRLTGDVIVYTHTEVEPEHEGKGIGSRLAKAVMEDARSRRRTVAPLCPYLSKWLQKHPEYDDILVRDTRRVK